MYTWSPFCPSNTDGIKCMPMMWGDKDASAIQSLVSKPATDANNVILFINEFVMLFYLFRFEFLFLMLQT